MQYEARGMLDDFAETVVKDAVSVTSKYHSDLPPEIQFTISVERAEGKLDGIYTMWLVSNDADRADDAVDVINDLVGQYHTAIADVVGFDPNDFDDSNGNNDTNMFST